MEYVHGIVASYAMLHFSKPANMKENDRCHTEGTPSDTRKETSYALKESIVIQPCMKCAVKSSHSTMTGLSERP
jgi:hypothetical protein